MADTSQPPAPPWDAALRARVPRALLPALDALAAELSAPGRTVTRSDVVRELLLEGVARRARAA